MTGPVGGPPGELPGEAVALAAKLGIVLGPEIAHHAHRVFAARTTGGVEAVLKLARPGTDWLASEARTLELQAGRHCARLLAAEPEGLLIERILPGRPVSELVLAGRDDEATALLAEAIAAFDLERSEDPVLRPIADRVTDLVAAGPLLDSIAPARRARCESLVAGAAATLDRLLAGGPAPVVLHGDLHHENLLDAGGAGWVAIDPHGGLGDPGYEVGQLMLNPRAVVDHLEVGELAALTERRLSLLASLLGSDRDRLAAWAFVKSVLAALWQLADGEQWPAAWRLAGLLAT